mmetsp:Transcript_3694/g.10432  ORF Transcript_3694/g.10432 Transcript_3694/m.10432 type:complete len:228 (-) Transcript_3694:21-704(-)
MGRLTNLLQLPFQLLAVADELGGLLLGLLALASSLLGLFLQLLLQLGAALLVVLDFCNQLGALVLCHLLEPQAALVTGDLASEVLDLRFELFDFLLQLWFVDEDAIGYLSCVFQLIEDLRLLRGKRDLFILQLRNRLHEMLFHFLHALLLLVGPMDHLLLGFDFVSDVGKLRCQCLIAGAVVAIVIIIIVIAVAVGMRPERAKVGRVKQRRFNGLQVALLQNHRGRS